MNKRAAVETLKVVIIALAVFLVLFFFTVGFAKFFVVGGGRTSEGDKLACLASVKAVSSARGSSIDVFNLQCDTNFYGDIKSKSRTQEDKGEDAKLVVAEMMYDCWYQFGQGKYDVFAGKMLETPSHCFICSKFKLADPEVVIKEEDFIEFLKNEEKIGTKTKYYDFLKDGLIWERNKEDKSKIKQDVFVNNIKFDKGFITTLKLLLVSIWEGITDRDKGPKTRDELIDDFMPAFEVTGKDSLVKDTDYAIVFHQVSDFYWGQFWVINIVGKNDIPPASIMITEYSNLGYDGIGCGVLQG